MLKNKSTPFLAFLQASGLILYIVLISLFFNFVAPGLPESSEEFYAPILMLLLLTISVVVCGLLFFGRAGMLFWEKKYREALNLVVWTVGWGVLYFLTLTLTIYNRI